jgi:hypothetical protein
VLTEIAVKRDVQRLFADNFNDWIEGRK